MKHDYRLIEKHDGEDLKITRAKTFHVLFIDTVLGQPRFRFWYTRYTFKASCVIICFTLVYIQTWASIIMLEPQGWASLDPQLQSYAHSLITVSWEVHIYCLQSTLFMQQKYNCTIYHSSPYVSCNIYEYVMKNVTLTKQWSLGPLAMYISTMMSLNDLRHYY